MSGWSGLDERGKPHWASWRSEGAAGAARVRSLRFLGVSKTHKYSQGLVEGEREVKGDIIT